MAAADPATHRKPRLLCRPVLPPGHRHNPDDNIFLECADAARADYLIAGNQRHFPKFWKKTKVITSREFISIAAPHLIAARFPCRLNLRRTSRRACGTYMPRLRRVRCPGRARLELRSCRALLGGPSLPFPQPHPTET